MYEGLPTRPLVFNDFSGGKTDNYLKCRPNQFQEADNLFISKDRRLITRFGQTVYDDTYYQIPAGQYRIGAMVVHDSELFFQSAQNFYYEASGWQTLTGQTGNAVFNAGATTNYIAFAQWNKHLIVVNDAFAEPQKIYKDTSGAWRVRTAGLPSLATNPTFTPGAPGAAHTYLYRIIYKYTYTAGQATFIDRGPISEYTVQTLNAIGPATNDVVISAIPVITNGLTHNYDTTAIKVEIYRTEDAGTVFYFVDEITNGTTTYDDDTTDAVLVTSELLYTEGGNLDRDPPPAAKYVVTANDIIWYGHIKEDGVIYTTRIRPSLKFDVDSCPQDNFYDLEDELTGMGSISIYPLAFCKDHIYRLEGIFNSDGSGGIQPREISRVTGCVSHLSIVSTLYGVYFAGNDGFYYTDGYRCMKVSDELNTTYKALTSTTTKQKNIYGVYDAQENRIFWTVQSSDDSLENDTLFVLDLRWGIEDGGVFTTLSGQDTFFPTCLVFYNKVLVRGDNAGYIYKFDDDATTDPKRDLLTTPADWEEQVITYDYKGPATDFGLPEIVKWVPMCSVTLQNETNVAMSVQSNTDDSGAFNTLKEVRNFSQLTWGDPTITWGSTTYDYAWNISDLIQAKRRMLTGTMKCEYRQMRFTNGFTNIYNSDTFGTVEVDGSAKTATLTDAADVDWPTDLVDYYITFAEDSYTENFLITVRSANVVTFSDPYLHSPTGTQEWIVRGYRKGEQMNLMSYALHYSLLGKTENPYKNDALATGENES